MSDVIPINVRTRAPAAALVDIEQTMSSEFPHGDSEHALIKEVIVQLRLGDWGAATAILKMLTETTAERLQKLLATSGFRMRPSLSGADAIPRESLIYSVRSETRVPVDQLARCLDDFAGNLARATGDQAQVRVIKLVLWAAASGRFTMMQSFLANMSYGYRAKLDSVLYDHDLMLWDPVRRRALRLTER